MYVELKMVWQKMSGLRCWRVEGENQAWLKKGRCDKPFAYLYKHDRVTSRGLSRLSQQSHPNSVLPSASQGI